MSTNTGDKHENSAQSESCLIRLLTSTLEDTSNEAAHGHFGNHVANAVAEYIRSYVLNDLNIEPGMMDASVVPNPSMLRATMRTIMMDAMRLWIAEEDTIGPLFTSEWLLGLGTIAYIAHSQDKAVDLKKIHDDFQTTDLPAIQMDTLWWALQLKPDVPTVSDPDEEGRTKDWLESMAKAKNAYVESRGLSLESPCRPDLESLTIDFSELTDKEKKIAHAIVLGLHEACRQIRAVPKLPEIVRDLPDITLLNLMTCENTRDTATAAHHFSTACIATLETALGRKPILQDLEGLMALVPAGVGAESVEWVLDPVLIEVSYKVNQESTLGDPKTHQEEVKGRL